MQVWTVGKGVRIGSKFPQTRLAANNFRDHEVFLPVFKGTGDYVAALTLGQTRGPFRTLTVSVRALRYLNLRRL